MVIRFTKYAYAGMFLFGMFLSGLTYADCGNVVYPSDMNNEFRYPCLWVKSGENLLNSINVNKGAEVIFDARIFSATASPYYVANVPVIIQIDGVNVSSGYTASAKPFNFIYKSILPVGSHSAYALRWIGDKYVKSGEVKIVVGSSNLAIIGALTNFVMD